MHPIARKIRPWTMWLALSTLGGMTLTAPASAQFPPGFSFPSTGTAAPTAQQPVGTVLTVPLSDFGTIVAQNAIRQNNVNLLQVTQTAVGDMNSQVATISIRQRNARDWTSMQPATTCWLPVKSLNWITQANKDTTIIEQNAFGFGNTQVAQVQVQQQNSATPVAPGTRFMMCPLWGVSAIQSLNQKNINVVKVSQLAVGDNNSQVAILAVDQQNAANLKVPATLTGPLVQLNLNLNIITQVAVGNGNTQVATVDVGQGNQL